MKGAHMKGAQLSSERELTIEHANDRLRGDERQRSSGDMRQLFVVLEHGAFA